MKKSVFILLFTLVNVCNLSAQSKTIIGKWKEEYRTHIDTTEQGFDELNQDFEAYKSGKKKLSKKFIVISKDEPEEVKSWVCTLIKRDGAYLLSDGTNTYKLKYNTKTKTYSTTLFDNLYLISLDEKTNNLVLKNKTQKGKNIIMKRV